MLEELKTFIAVVEEKSFTKAADIVNLSQPSVSVHIKHLENYFDANLITRCTKPQKLIVTESGNLLYKRSKQLLALLETTKDELRHMDSDFKGHIKIGATSTIAECILPSFLTKFCEHYQDVHIEVIIGNSSDITNKMKSLQLDLALVEGALSFPAFSQRCFFNDQLVLILPVSYISNEDPLVSTLLNDHRWITRERGSGLRECVDGFLVANEIIPHTKLILSSNYAIKESVANGLGVSIIPRSLIHNINVSDTLKVVKLNTNFKIAFSSLLPKDIPITPITTIFLESFVSYTNKTYNYLD